MLCVLQIKGTSLKAGISTRFANSFYRADVSDDGDELLFYDVASATSSTELAEQIKQFIAQNKDGLIGALECREQVQLMNLDVGIFMDEVLSRTAAFDRELIAMLAEFGISVSISAYQSRP